MSVFSVQPRSILIVARKHILVLNSLTSFIRLLPLMALNSINCADMPLRNYSISVARSAQRPTAMRYDLHWLDMTGRILLRIPVTVYRCLRGSIFCSVLFFSRPRSEGWPHHGRTFSIYLYPLSFWL